MMRSRSSKVPALFAGLLVLAVTGVAAKRSPPECPGGCIIASEVSPARKCTCVVPQCSSWAAAFGPIATATHIKDGGVVARPQAASLGGLDCSFCDTEAFVYGSYAECYAADDAFRPKGPSIHPSSYPDLAHGRVVRRGGGARLAEAAGLMTPADAAEAEERASSGNRRMLLGQLGGSCPPANPCLDTSSYVTWEAAIGTNTTATSDVTIPVGTPVVLHGCAQPNSTVTVRSINVPVGATLVIGDSPLSLNIMYNLVVGGTFQMGTPSCPIQSTMTVFMPGGNVNGSVGIYALRDSTYDVHGAFTGLSWTRIASTVATGANSIPLMEPVQWQPGDKFFITTTTWKDELQNQNEVLTVQSVSADKLTITTVEKLQFQHYGKEYKAEVGLLTRRILFTSDNTSSATGLGPHTMLITSNARVSGVAVQRWGTRNIMGHYPLHYHLSGNTTNAWMRNNAIYESNWRCITVHGTNSVTLQHNVGFNVFGHCYYLENGVEENNIIDHNLAAYVHPMIAAGSGGGQLGTDRWANASLADPTDAGAGGFYSLNLFNTWTNNAASGGFAGFSFPHAPRAIKENRTALWAFGPKAGWPFDPSQRPFVLFQGNTAHSTGYFWEHGGAIYFGGMLFYKTDPSDGQVKLFYNNGRGSILADPLCPDPLWPASDSANAGKDCYVGAARSTKTADNSADAFVIVTDVNVALANVGVMSWGSRQEVHLMRAYDVSRGAELLGDSWLDSSLVRVNTDNSVGGFSGWPFASTQKYWESFPIKGFEVYDTMASFILTNLTFENYKFKQYTTDRNNWWFYQTPYALRQIAFSDQFKPDKTMTVSKGITCNNCDIGTCYANNTCSGGAFFRVENKDMASSWLFTWLDSDGSIVRAVAPSKAAQPYLISSYPSWWKLDDTNSWTEPHFGVEYLAAPWVSPMPASEVVARLEMRVTSPTNATDLYTFSEFDVSPIKGGSNNTHVGFVSPYGSTAKRLPLTRSEGTVGLTGTRGWYAVWNSTSNSSYTAPKRLELILFNVPRGKVVYWTSCWPAGTTFTVNKTFAYTPCQNQVVRAVTSRNTLLASGGDVYWVDTNGCLNLKLTDPGTTSTYTNSFQRAGLYVEKEVRWYDLRYQITTNAAGGDAYFVPLPGDPATRVPAVIASQPASCSDVAPPSGVTCGGVTCGWYGVSAGCYNPTIYSNGYCQASCGFCPNVDPAPPQMKLAFNITKATVNGGKNMTCSCTVKVTDTSGIPLGGAKIMGTWITTKANLGWPYAVTTSTATATTNTTILGSTSNQRSPQLPLTLSDCRFAVSNVTLTGYVLDPLKTPAANMTSPTLSW